MLYIKTSR